MLVPNERGLDRALELGCRHIAIFGSATETFAQRNLNRSLDEQFAMFEPTVVARPRRRARRARLREHVLRRPVGGRRADRPGGRGRQAPLRPRCQPALARRHHRRRDRRSRARAADRAQRRRACPTRRSPCTSTTPTGRRSPTPSPRSSTASPRSTPAPAASAGARTPRAPPATSPPRTSSGCCTAWASRPGSTSAALVQTSSLDGRRARPPQPVARRGGAVTGTMTRMSRRVYLHVGTPKSGTSYLQDKLALNRAAARAAGPGLPPAPGPATTSRRRWT